MVQKEVFLFSAEQINGPRSVMGYPDLTWKPFSPEVNERVKIRVDSKKRLKSQVVSSRKAR